jgi:uncharacterized protein (UPF0332 family)
MMRGPGLAEMLESAHLWHDPGAAAQVPKDLEKAEKILKDAPGQKDALEQINWAYQAGYCATQALLHSIQYKATNFRAIVTVLEDYFMKNGKLKREHIDALLRAQKMEGTPQENFDAMAAYIAAVKEAIGK